jgi:hypothetical protein
MSVPEPSSPRWLRRVGRLGLTVAFAALVAVAGWVVWARLADPLGSLPVDPTAAVVVEAERRIEPASAISEPREVRRLVLRSTVLGDIRVALSLPTPLPDRAMPVLVLLGGHRTGRDSVAYVPRPGHNVLVGYDYPFDRHLKLRWSLLPELPRLRRRLLDVPGQVAALIAWLRTQAWADRDRISLLGFSLGALYLPAVHRVAGRQGLLLGPAVIAYGGADLPTLVRNRLAHEPAWRGILAAGLVGLMLRPLEPAQHLPHLDGEFLLLGSADADKFIPPESAALLQRLTPEPKTVVRLEGGHIGGRRTALTHAIVAAARAWLAARRAIDP